MPDGHDYSDETKRRARFAYEARAREMLRYGSTVPTWESLGDDQGSAERNGWFQAIYELDASSQ
jgi:hypothetical protein